MNTYYVTMGQISEMTDANRWMVDRKYSTWYCVVLIIFILSDEEVEQEFLNNLHKVTQIISGISIWTSEGKLRSIRKPAAGGRRDGRPGREQSFCALYHKEC